MSVLAIVLIVVGVLPLVLLIGGFVVTRRRVGSSDYTRNIERADRALEEARAEDRGWDRAALELACQAALRTERPGVAYEAIDLVLVDDRPGVVDDRAHLVARGEGGPAPAVL